MNNQKKRKQSVTVVLLTVFIFAMTLLPAPVFAGGNVPVTVDIKVTYKVDGNAGAAGGDRFTLSADDACAPMPVESAGGKKTITIPDEGSYSFGDIHFDRPEVFWYTITREAQDKKGVVKDTSKYRAKVVALNDGHGYVFVYKSGSDKKHELVYMDRVTPDTGDDSRIIFYCSLAAAAAAVLMLLAAAVMRSRKKEVQSETEKNI